MMSQSKKSIEIEQAIIQPSQTFKRPREVLENDELSDALKLRILQSWRLDLHRQLTDSERDVPELDEFTTLSEINDMLETLKNHA